MFFWASAAQQPAKNPVGPQVSLAEARTAPPSQPALETHKKGRETRNVQLDLVKYLKASGVSVAWLPAVAWRQSQSEATAARFNLNLLGSFPAK